MEFREEIIDSLCMHVVTNPERYDIIVLPNLYGDILSEISAGLVGGIGIVPSANIGNEAAVFEPAHGSAPQYAGKNRVNPMAMMLSAAMLLKHIGEVEAASSLEEAIAAIITEGKTLTYDLKSNPDDPTAATTSQVADAICKKLKEV